MAFQIDRESDIVDVDKFGNVQILSEVKDTTLLSIDFRPRSSIYKTGMVLSNSIGTIDELYSGEVCAIFYHFLPDMPRYHKGDKIGQIKLGITLPMDFIEVDELDKTERGDGGFGSTDIKKIKYV